MNNKIIIFSDADGTLYDKNFQVREDTKKNIDFALSLGGVFVVTTGNPPFNRHQKLGNDIGARYLITSNGATIFDNVEKKYIYKNIFTIELQNKILNLAKKYQSQVNYWTDEEYFTFNQKPEFVHSYYYSLFEPKKFIKEFSDSKENVVKMEVFDKEENIQKIYDELKNLDLEIVRMRAEHLEITPKNSSKGNAVKWLCDFLNANIENVMSIGDSPNDWSMLTITGYSYAMANANKETKAKAKFHTSACDQNGVGMAIIDYLHRIKADR